MNQHLKEIGVLVATVALLGVLAIFTHGYFSASNLTDLFLSIMPVMIVAIGMTLIVLTGHIDISVGSTFAVCSVVMGTSVAAGIPIAISAVIACLLGGLCGALNGVLTSYVGIPSIVVTLATMVTLRDALRWSTQGSWISNLPAGFQRFGLSPIAYTLLCALCVTVLIAVSIYALRYLHLGRIVVATGSNEAAARTMGINTNLVVISVFIITGLLAGMGSALNAARFNQIPSNLGLGLELKVIAAVAVGGAAITGGSASIAGTALGVILLGCISSALTFLQISAYWEKAIQGAIILLAVSADAVQLYRRPNATIIAN